MQLLSEIIKAEQNIRAHILKTPLIESKYLSQLNQGKVFLKLESEQYTGSFKARGSMNKILSLSAEQKAKGVITASTGNHALGFARALELTETKGIIYLPENAVSSKVEALQHYTAELRFHGNDSLETELYAKKIAQETGAIWVSPYNDSQIIAGQGTIGIELMEQLYPIDNILITVGGGGLISGIGTFLKAVSPNTKIIGCQPENSPEMYLSVKAGEIKYMEKALPTLSDGSAGGLEPEAITFPICQKIVDEFILVSEAEIASAIKLMVDKHHKIIEGAAAVALASFIKQVHHFKNKNIVIIICGGNIDTQKLIQLF